MQHSTQELHIFSDDKPPIGKSDMPKHDYMEDPKPRDMPRKELEVLLKAANLSRKGKILDLQHQVKNNNPPIETKKSCHKLIEG